ncbi:uncharacterized protein LOC134292162 [Aedes albopictus]|uniref:Integrase catalytic domain-containing protein n=1 Tax=Aedes albopictus TaxID=7160 RepID=A0ABM1ZSN1_AEDAL
MDGVKFFEIMGFADASSKAYGCCVYLRGVKFDGTAEMKLLCGRSRVAPLKEGKRIPRSDNEPGELTIPRLELCAAKLLTEQVLKITDAVEVKIDRIVLWSDSKIVLRWIDYLKADAPVFVRNRITCIRQATRERNYEWKYIPSEFNPADLISRGVYPASLKAYDFWWQGPAFLQAADFEECCKCEHEPGEANNRSLNDEVVAAAIIPDNSPMAMTMKHSDFRKLQRIFGYVTRFVQNCRKAKGDRRTGGLQIGDHREAMLTLVRIVQFSTYGTDIDKLLKGKSLNSKLSNFKPIFDADERLLRVGGRIRNSDLPRNQRHPLILPDKNHLTEIIINALHREYLHVGQNGLLAIVRQQFWPMNAKRTINRVLRKCVRCFRVKPRDVDLLMGDLPSFRVTVSHPFMRTGVDYAGPVLLKQGRMKAPIKAYIALFVCMATKAIHIELVSSLSTDSFLAALHRFVGRRGNVAEILSDNGKNFIGANRQLKELQTLTMSDMMKQEIAKFCQPKGIMWNFNPPKAPHQGGLWEAGVKSAKFHLHRILKEAYLTYEEMSTLLVQIEAILNSRPLCEQSTDPMDYEALSPAHFLVGRELTAEAEPMYDHLKENTLSRYQLVQCRKQACPH